MATISKNAKRQYANEISFAYCGFAFFADHGHVFLNKSMILILTAYFTLRNCSKTSVLTISWFLGHFFIFEHFNAIFEPHRPIQNCSRVTQISITIGTLCFCKKKVKKISFNTIFLGKIAVFCNKNRFFFFFGSSQVKMNIRILFYSLFRSPVQKSGMGPFFFFHNP